MRQAILITAYHDYQQLRRLIDYFDSDFEIYIHLDRRSPQMPNDLLKRPCVHVFQHYRVFWGSMNHLRAILQLMDEALKHKDLEYFHLVTGNDYPIPSLSSFSSFCESHRNDNFLEFFKLPRSLWDSEGGLARVKYYWLQRWLQPNESNTVGRHFTNALVKIQRKLGMRRSFRYFDGNLFGGGTYWSLSREALDYAIAFLNANPGYLRRFRGTKIAEEICLPTIWANSTLPLTNNSLRYIEWGSGASPNVLTENDYKKIMCSGCLFARKIMSSQSDALIKKMQQYQREF